MIRLDAIQQAAVGLVGWKQPTKSGSVVVTAENKATSSGMYFQDGSGLVTLENLKNSLSDSAISDANFNTYLGELVKAGFVDVLNQIFTEEDFVENRALYLHPNRYGDTIDNTTRFVGYEIQTRDAQELAVILNQITLEFDGVDSVKVLLFNSTKLAPVQTKTVATVANTAVNTDLGWVLDRTTDYKGGIYYIGYLQNGLTAKAINRDWKISNIETAFHSCRIKSIEVPGWNSETLFDIDDIKSASETWGINLDISAYVDYTGIALRNKSRFAKALQLQVCARVLDVISTSVTSTRVERLSKNHAMLELNGNKSNPDFPNTIGVLGLLGQEIKRLKSNYTATPPIRSQQL